MTKPIYKMTLEDVQAEIDRLEYDYANGGFIYPGKRIQNLYNRKIQIIKERLHVTQTQLATLNELGNYEQ